MAIERFSLESLAHLDNGRLRAGLDQALRRAQNDCTDRPGLKKPRRITLTIDMTPVPNEAGDLDSCDVAFQVTERTPNRQSKVYNMKATAGGLLFNELSPSDIKQSTLDQAGPRKETGT